MSSRPSRIRETERWSCGCFVDVYVCPAHLEKASVYLGGLTGEDQLGIFDNEVSVSALDEDEEAVVLENKVMERQRLPFEVEGGSDVPCQGD